MLGKASREIKLLNGCVTWRTLLHLHCSHNYKKSSMHCNLYQLHSYHRVLYGSLCTAGYNGIPLYPTVPTLCSTHPSLIHCSFHHNVRYGRRSDFLLVHTWPLKVKFHLQRNESTTILSRFRVEVWNALGHLTLVYDHGLKLGQNSTSEVFYLHIGYIHTTRLPYLLKPKAKEGCHNNYSP